MKLEYSVKDNTPLTKHRPACAVPGNLFNFGGMMENPYDEKLKTIKELKKLWDLFPYYPNHPIDSPFILICGSDSMVVQIWHLENLTSARSFVQSFYPKWKDTLKNVIGTSDGNAVAMWEDETHPLIEIWLRTPVDKFPKELLPSEECRFEKQTDHNEYNLICPVRE